LHGDYKILSVLIAECRELNAPLIFFYPTIQLSKIKNFHGNMATVRGLDEAKAL